MHPILFISRGHKGNSPITNPLLIPTPSRLSVTIRGINKLYKHNILVMQW